jgi:hypothetical protein
MIEENCVWFYLPFSLHEICKKSCLCEKNGLVAQYHIKLSITVYINNCLQNNLYISWSFSGKF